MKKKFEEAIKEKIKEMVNRMGPGARIEIFVPLEGNVIIEKTDMIEAIFKVIKFRKRI